MKNDASLRNFKLFYSWVFYFLYVASGSVQTFLAQGAFLHDFRCIILGQMTNLYNNVFNDFVYVI